MASTSTDSTDMELVARFLLLGQVGSGHSTEAAKSSSVMSSRHTEIDAVIERIIADGQGQRLLDEVSKPSFTVSRTAAAYVLASCSTSSDEHFMASALKALPSVCPASKELLAFVHARETLCKTSRNTSGWGRALRRAVKRWYEEKPPIGLAVECANRQLVQDGWTHRDVLRLAHINSQNIGTAAVIRYVTHGLERAEMDFGSETKVTADVIKFLKDYQLFGKPEHEQLTALLIRKYSFAFESLPSGLKKSLEVLQSIIPKLPLDQLLSRLRWFAKSGFLSSRSVLLPFIVDRLLSADGNAIAEVHPIIVYTVLMKFEDPEKKIYAAKAVVTKTDETNATAKPRSSAALIKPWLSCQPAIINALKILITTTTKHFPISGKRYLIAVDVRSSMFHSKLLGCRQMTAIEAAIILVQPLIIMEKSVTVVAFSEKNLKPVDIRPGKSVEEVKEKISYIPVGPVDCAKPMLWAKEMKCPYDVFMILTDRCIDIVDVKPAEALRQYRQEMNLPKTRVVIHALSLGHGEPIDDGPGVLYVFGMSLQVPHLIRQFVAHSSRST